MIPATARAFGAHAPSEARLWMGVALAPAAWSVAELVGYIGAGRGCWGIWPNGRSVGPASSVAWVLIVSGLMLVAAATGLWIAIDNVRRTETTMGRMYFMGVLGVGASSLFLAGIVLFALPPVFIHACTAVR
ncbi:MAG TPA: hypothetical protein VHW65_10675 [Gemmatimonadales bacterium]|jgi:hypothetical protein|nr:hypothetical protein [Gemmatimonadales bacterium]